MVKIFVFILFAYLFFLIFKPFIPALVLALAFAIVAAPLTQIFRKKVGLGDSMSAFLTVLLTLLFIILPLTLLLTLLTKEAIVFAKTIDFEALNQAFNSLTTWNIFGYQIDLTALKENLVSTLSSLGSYASSKSLTLLSSISNSLFLFFVFLLLYFYFLRDQNTLLKNLKNVLPYEKAQQKTLFTSFHEISKTIFYGNTLCALIAGLVAYLGFLIFGFKGALIWGLLAAIFSFIPTVGTLLIYLTGIVLLAFTDGWVAAVSMAVYFVVVEMLLRETWIRGKILEDKLKFHPIMVFFALVGGVGAFGSMGLVYGPLIITFLGTLYQFYAADTGRKKADQ